jgi:hypothetical protein
MVVSVAFRLLMYSTFSPFRNWAGGCLRYERTAIMSVNTPRQSDDER